MNGSSASVGSAFGAEVDSFRLRSGRVFYSAIRQPGVPRTDSRRGHRHRTHHKYGRLKTQAITHDFVPNGGLTPQGLLEAYQATPLSNTVQGWVRPSFPRGSPVEQSDLDAFTPNSPSADFSFRSWAAMRAVARARVTRPTWISRRCTTSCPGPARLLQHPFRSRDHEQLRPRRGPRLSISQSSPVSFLGDG